jgi:hypothetical protein
MNALQNTGTMNLVTTLVNTMEALLRPENLSNKADQVTSCAALDSIARGPALPRLKCQLAALALLPNRNRSQTNRLQGLFETYFVFAAIWAFGGALVEKDGIDYRRRFDKWWKTTWTTVKLPGVWGSARGKHGKCSAPAAQLRQIALPSPMRAPLFLDPAISAADSQESARMNAQTHARTRPPKQCPPPPSGKGSVFDYFVSAKTAKFTPWAELVADTPYDSTITPMGSVFVPTPETASLRFFLDAMVRASARSRPADGGVGPRAGCGAAHAWAHGRRGGRLCARQTLPAAGPSNLAGNHCRRQVELGKPIMFVGGAGVGKTQLVKGKLAALPDETLALAIAFNYFTDVASFQKVWAGSWVVVGAMVTRCQLWGEAISFALPSLPKAGGRG